MNPSKKRKLLGQFYTDNYKYILQNLEINPNVKCIIEPFAGNGDILEFIEDKNKYEIKCYDIDPLQEWIEKRDTIKNPPEYKGNFVLTNPPYLFVNQAPQEMKDIFNRYKTDDLYKCFLLELISQKPMGGIIIIPVNFFCTQENETIKLRAKFLNIFEISIINIFEERVFLKTKVSICSFQFSLKEISFDNSSNLIPVHIYPQDEIIKVNLNETNNYMFGGEIYKLPVQKKYKICRENNKKKANTHILVQCIDNKKGDEIKFMKLEEKGFKENYDWEKSRSYIKLVITPQIDSERQDKLINEFNEFLNTKRQTYHSLFLLSWRESKDIARKMISFKLIYEIVGYLLTR